MELISGYLKTQDGIFISTNHYLNGHKKAVIIAHGFYNSKNSLLLQKLKDSLIKKYDVFLFDFRGHGESGGVFTLTSKESLDLQVVIEHLKERYKKIGVVGFSLGGSIAINTMALDPKTVKSLVCVSSPSDVSKVDYKIFEPDAEKDIFYALFLKDGKIGKGVKPGPFWLAKTRPVDSAPKLKASVLYITGDKDWLVKPWHSQALYDSTKSRKKLLIVKTGSHAEYMLQGYFKILLSAIENWFSKTL